VVSQAGQPLKSQPGSVPGRPDGTASFGALFGGVFLVNNHEQGG
jgi:hypothetical protein